MFSAAVVSSYSVSPAPKPKAKPSINELLLIAKLTFEPFANEVSSPPVPPSPLSFEVNEGAYSTEKSNPPNEFA